MSTLSRSEDAPATSLQQVCTPLPERVRVLIVGAGFAGLGTAIKLQEQGVTDYVVVERGEDVGGTWRDNTYPGAACDVPSQLYSFSFAPNPEWSRSFSPQPEIQAYLQRVARERGVLEHFVFGTEVTGARWDPESHRWLVETTGPAGERQVSAQVLVTGSGGLSEPRLPDIEGIESFTGTIFHSARWNHDYDLTGKRVAVIGTGASAIQIVPEVAQKTAHLDVYQRTAPWVIPRNDRSYTRLERFGFRRLPLMQKVYRTAIYWGREAYIPAFTMNPKLAEPARQLGLLNIRRGIRDKDLRAKVTPHFRVGCKRVLISNTWYPTLDRDDVDLVTDPIERVTPTGITTRDGTHREADALIVATGFYTTDQPIAHHVIGREGLSLAETWSQQGMAAYKGTTINGFPNLFQIVGPNTGLGHSSMVFIIESQIAYITDALRRMEEDGLVAVEPTREAQDAWNEDLQKRMGHTVWSTGGCASWYLDERGVNTTLWPKATFTFRRQLSRFDPDAYAVERTGSRTSQREGAPA